MTEVLSFPFMNSGKTVRAVLIDDEPWFVAKDVGDILGHSNIRVVVGRLPERMRGVTNCYTPSGQQGLSIVSEPGIYRLVMRSTVPVAEAFQDWLAEDVIPSIRKTGSYTLDKPQEVLTSISDVQTRLEAAEEKAALWEASNPSTGTFTASEAARVFFKEHNVKTGQNRIMALLKEMGWVMNNNSPYQSYMERGYLEGKIEHIPFGKGRFKPYMRTYVTRKGMEKLYTVLLEKNLIVT